MSFSPQTHNLCQQHFVFADHKPSQFHHQTGPICRAPFLQPSAFDEACGGQWGSACACLLALPALSPTFEWHLPCHRGLHCTDFRGRLAGWLCLCLGFSSQSLLSEPKEETTSNFLEGPGLYFSADLSLTSGVQEGCQLCELSLTVCAVAEEQCREKHQIGKVVLKTTGLMRAWRREPHMCVLSCPCWMRNFIRSLVSYGSHCVTLSTAGGSQWCQLQVTGLCTVPTGGRAPLCCDQSYESSSSQPRTS